MNYDPFFNRRKNLRLPDYDYSTPNYYFVTICTKNRECILGEIVNNEMILSKIGQIINNQWIAIKEYYKHIQLDEFIIMPNHIHGIIFINDVGARFIAPDNKNEIFNNNKMKGAINRAPTLGHIIWYFKGRTLFIIRKKFKCFQWQRNYYEHIIRNEKSLERIRYYIGNNPYNWSGDRNNPRKMK